MCEHSTTLLGEVDRALAAADASTRDATLAGIEACPAFPAGIVRALRAELAPAGCADQIVEPFLAKRPTTLRKDVADVLFGLAIGARLARLASSPPRLTPPYDKARFRDFFQTRLVPWIQTQAKAIHEQSVAGARLTGYGKGIVAVEAGLSDMRFVELVRNVPLPQEMAEDGELRDTYYASLDQALDPRKDRGRDAALVGLREFAHEGILNDRRIDEARGLLSKLYAGRRIDALDGLLLPELPPLELKTVEQRLAAKLPTFYAGFILRQSPASDAGFLRALVERGLPAATRASLESGKPTGPTLELYARALVELGKRYWRSEDFRRAASRAAEGKETSEALRLVAALASALEAGPRDAAEMMLRGPFLPSGIGNVAKLDALARGKGALAGMAAYDAAYVLGLVPPKHGDPEFWKDLAGRFRRAAKLLGDKGQIQRAIERAKAAEDTAAALR